MSEQKRDGTSRMDKDYKNLLAEDTITDKTTYLWKSELELSVVAARRGVCGDESGVFSTSVLLKRSDSTPGVGNLSTSKGHLNMYNIIDGPYKTIILN